MEHGLFFAQKRISFGHPLCCSPLHAAVLLIMGGFIKQWDSLYVAELHSP